MHQGCRPQVSRLLEEAFYRIVLRQLRLEMKTPVVVPVSRSALVALEGAGEDL